MNYQFTKAECQRVDLLATKVYGMESCMLMENAGRGAVDTLLPLLADVMIDSKTGKRDEVVILCGKGNNAGDGFVMARHLDNRGIRVRVLLLVDPSQLSGDALLNWNILVKSSIPYTVFQASNANSIQAWLCETTKTPVCLVDAMLGTGASGTPRKPYAEAIEWFNEQTAMKIAVDIPSGLDCDSGSCSSVCIRADHTFTFVAIKSGFEIASAKKQTGLVHVVDIGVPRKLLSEISKTTLPKLN